METEKKEKLKKAFIVFLKALIPPLVALVSSVLTVVLGGDGVTGTLVGSVTGVASNALTYHG